MFTEEEGEFDGGREGKRWRAHDAVYETHRLEPANPASLQKLQPPGGRGRDQDVCVCVCEER